MVRHDDAHPMRLGKFDLGDGGRTAVAGQKHPRTDRIGVIDRHRVYAVALALAVRDMRSDDATHVLKVSREEGGARHAINVVVAVDKDRQLTISSVEQNVPAG